ncbi:hypothetical protein [Streptomyces qinglanensis]|uniref:Lipoprotein n=1 Tax=Streptomyces qinglanensis TaxID=943816 RepID=A0A1H9NCS6_9ACTN|nr:hypothetical protein [Streptomyces qinglanensis]SER33515.1 hypothetical protein SAMN05421870_101272 [Streptomyces qinglanensis]
MKKQAGTAMWTAGALAASLLLGACGSDGGSDGKIDGADDGAKKTSKSPSPSQSSDAPGHKAPEDIKLAKDAKNVFEDTETGNPEKDAVLADNQARINAVDRVITTGKEPDLVKVYAKGKSLLASNEYILDFANDGMSWAGVTRYYDQKVEFTGKSDARVTFCADESKAQNKVIKTGKLEPNDGGDQNYVFASFHTKRNSDGVWQAVSGSSQRGAEQCMK